MNIEPKIFASKSHLKRNWPLNNRITAYRNTVENLRNRNLNSNEYCIVIVEKFFQGEWSDQIYYIQKIGTVNHLYRKIVGNSKEAFFFFTPKTHTQIMNTKTFQEIYDSYRDPDDNFVYMKLVSIESFG